MINRTMRRHQRKIAIALMILNFSGARAIAITDPCQRCKVLYGPSLGFKAIARTISGQGWEQSPPRAFGIAHNHVSARDIESVYGKRRMAPVAISYATHMNFDGKNSSAGVRDIRKLPSDTSPIQPSHLYSKK